ncbi:hypothetical protein UlMin_020434 [Ulmus minor]
MGRQHQQSLRSNATHFFFSDLTTSLLNPIFDKPFKPHLTISLVSSISEEKTRDLVDGPYTFSFTIFLYSLLSSLESAGNPNSDEHDDDKVEKGNPSSDSTMKESGGRISLFSKGKQTLSRAVFQGDRNSDMKMDGKNENGANSSGLEMRHLQKLQEPVTSSDSPDISEPSMLLSENTKTSLYASLPALVQGRKWLLLYSTWSTELLMLVLYCHHSFAPFSKKIKYPLDSSHVSLLLIGPNDGRCYFSCPIKKVLLVLSHPTYLHFALFSDLEEFVPQKTSTYVSQHDLHIPEMTVRETLEMLWMYGFIYVRIFYFVISD